MKCTINTCWLILTNFLRSLEIANLEHEEMKKELTNNFFTFRCFVAFKYIFKTNTGNKLCRPEQSLKLLIIIYFRLNDTLSVLVKNSGFGYNVRVVVIIKLNKTTSSKQRVMFTNPNTYS